MITDIKLEDDTYDDEAISIYTFQGYHCPTAILETAIVITIKDELELDCYDAEDKLRSFLAANLRQWGSIIFVHNMTKKLMRITLNKRTGLKEVIALT